MVSELLVIDIIIFLTEILNYINITDWEKDIYHKHDNCFKNGKEYCPKSNDLSPRETWFYSN